MQHAITQGSVVVAREDIVSTDLADETILLDLQAGTYYGLRGVGADVWKMLHAPIAVDRICEHLYGSFDVEPERCREELLDLLQSMADEGLITLAHAPRA